MINQFEYMKLRPVMELAFEDDMETANSIIKAIQTYQEDDEFVPKVKSFRDMCALMNTVTFTIDSADMEINLNRVHYNIELIIDSTKDGKRIINDYKIKVSAACNIPHRDPISFSIYATRSHDVGDIIAYIEKGMFDEAMSRILGAVAWRIQRICMREAKKYIKKNNEELRNWSELMDKYLTEPPKPIEFNMIEIEEDE